MARNGSDASFGGAGQRRRSRQQSGEKSLTRSSRCSCFTKLALPYVMC